MSNTRSIAIVGVGGQGTVLTSDILIEAWWTWAST